MIVDLAICVDIHLFFKRLDNCGTQWSLCIIFEALDGLFLTYLLHLSISLLIPNFTPLLQALPIGARHHMTQIVDVNEACGIKPAHVVTELLVRDELVAILIHFIEGHDDALEIYLRCKKCLFDLGSSKCTMLRLLVHEYFVKWFTRVVIDLKFWPLLLNHYRSDVL